MEVNGFDGKLLAVQSLIPWMNFRLAQPAVIVDLNGVTELTLFFESRRRRHHRRTHTPVATRTRCDCLRPRAIAARYDPVHRPSTNSAIVVHRQSGPR